MSVTAKIPAGPPNIESTRWLSLLRQMRLQMCLQT
jgi:hypothetical protein